MREARRSTSFKYTTWVLAMQCGWTLMSIRINHPFHGGKSLLARQEDSKFEILYGDFLVHHAIALGLHTTTLILVKGALDARGSKLMPDKKDFGYSFPCDGPGRGGIYSRKMSGKQYTLINQSRIRKGEARETY
ncbi:unnamed protein product [Lupinus luteus]|uniref:Uncharacterized protein n=1 Tax=Lupinus luteus TaxID=3873 RepID=A0AAV1W9X8_LUPLU